MKCPEKVLKVLVCPGAPWQRSDTHSCIVAALGQCTVKRLVWPFHQTPFQSLRARGKLFIVSMSWAVFGRAPSIRACSLLVNTRQSWAWWWHHRAVRLHTQGGRAHTNAQRAARKDSSAVLRLESAARFHLVK